VREKPPNRLIEKPGATQIRKAESRALYFGKGRIDYGPVVTAALPRRKHRIGWCRTGVDEGATAVVETARFQLQGMKPASLLARTSFDNVTPDMDMLQARRFSGQFCPRTCIRLRRGVLRWMHEMGTAPRIFTRDGDAARDFCRPRERRTMTSASTRANPSAGLTTPLAAGKKSGLCDLNQHGRDAFKF